MSRCLWFCLFRVPRCRVLGALVMLSRCSSCAQMEMLFSVSSGFR